MLPCTAVWTLSHLENVHIVLLLRLSFLNRNELWSDVWQNCRLYLTAVNLHIIKRSNEIFCTNCQCEPFGCFHWAFLLPFISLTTLSEKVSFLNLDYQFLTYFLQINCCSFACCFVYYIILYKVCLLHVYVTLVAISGSCFTNDILQELFEPMDKCKLVMEYSKLINSQQAKVAHTCRDTKEKLHTTNAALY